VLVDRKVVRNPLLHIASAVRQNAKETDKMNAQRFLYLIFITFLVTLASCNKCNKGNKATLKFTQEDLKINPYSLNDSVTFTLINSDDIYMIVSSRESQTSKIIEYTTWEVHECYNYALDEMNFTKLSNSDQNSWLKIDLGFTFSFKELTAQKVIRIYFSFNTADSIFFDAKYQYDNDSLFYLSSEYANPNDKIVQYHTYITIGPKNYNNVYELLCHDGTTAYYSTQEGLVGCHNNLGKTWYLKNKK
jgi:hypothetical protein